MAILDYALSIQELGKFLTSSIPSNYEGEDSSRVSTINSSHPFLAGKFTPVFTMSPYTSTDARYVFDFSRSDDRPVLGDVFSFRYERYGTPYARGATSAFTPNQYLIQFQDSAGNTIGGIRQAPSSSVTTASARSYVLVAGTNTYTLAGSTLYPDNYGGAGDSHVISCQVTASLITISVYAASAAETLAGTPPALVYSLTCDNTSLAYGAPAKMRWDFSHGTATSTTYVYLSLIHI